MLAALVGDDELAAAARFAKPESIEAYYFDKDTHQKVVVDWRDTRPGDKQYHWEQRGVPFRMEVGPRDVDQQSFILKGRTDGSKQPIKLADVSRDWFRGKLDAAHNAMFEKARKFRDENTRPASSYDELK